MRTHTAAAKPPRGAPVALAELARHELAIPSRPHAIRMRLGAALAEAGHRPRVALELDSVPALLDMVQRHSPHAVLGLGAVRGTPYETRCVLRPIVAPGGAARAVPLYIATSAQWPGGALLDQATALLAPMLRGATEAV